MAFGDAVVVPGPNGGTSPYPDPNRPIPPLHQVLDDIPRQEQILGHDATMRGLAIWVTVGFFTLMLVSISLVIFKPDISAFAQSLIFSLTTLVGTKWSTVVDFYFGSSAGSARKSTVIGSALTKATNDKP